jgi:imidazolonepropionase-like amidohydrolase
VAEEVRELQQALAHPVDGSLLIRGARIFDSERAVLGPAGNVLVRDGSIVEVDTSGGESRAARTADRVVEAGGRALLPGLFDAAAAEGWGAPLRLAAGVTTVRTEVKPAASADAAPVDATILHRLERRVASGASPASALQAATWGAARDAGVLDERGSITAGKHADLVLVDGDPTSDITALRRTALVLRGDVLFHPSEIRRAYGLAPTTAAIRPVAPPPRGRSRLDAEAQPLPSRYYD